MERVQATITVNDLGKGTATNPSSRLEAQAMANCRKVHAGHFLAKNLGGSGGVGHVFPQTPGINMGLYRAFEMDIANKIRDHGSGKVDILFNYPNANSKMPNAIFYTYEVGGKRVRGNQKDRLDADHRYRCGRGSGYCHRRGGHVFYRRGGYRAVRRFGTGFFGFYRSRCGGSRCGRHVSEQAV